MSRGNQWLSPDAQTYHRMSDYIFVRVALSPAGPNYEPWEAFFLLLFLG